MDLPKSTLAVAIYVIALGATVSIADTIEDTPVDPALIVPEEDTSSCENGADDVEGCPGGEGVENGDAPTSSEAPEN